MDLLAKLIPGFSGFPQMVIAIICMVIVIALTFRMLEEKNKIHAEMLDKQSSLFQSTLLQTLQSSEKRAQAMMDTQKEISGVLRALESEKKLEQFQVAELLKNQMANNKEMLGKLNEIMSEVKSQKTDTDKQLDLLTNKLENNLSKYCQNGVRGDEKKGAFI